MRAAPPKRSGKMRTALSRWRTQSLQPALLRRVQPLGRSYPFWPSTGHSISLGTRPELCYSGRGGDRTRTRITPQRIPTLVDQRRARTSTGILSITAIPALDRNTIASGLRPWARGVRKPGPSGSAGVVKGLRPWDGEFEVAFVLSMQRPSRPSARRAATTSAGGAATGDVPLRSPGPKGRHNCGMAIVVGGSRASGCSADRSRAAAGACVSATLVQHRGVGNCNAFGESDVSRAQRLPWCCDTAPSPARLAGAEV